MIHDSVPLRIIRISPAAITPREAEVLDLAHLQYADIGAELGIKEATVRSHMKSARLKLGAESRTHAALIWQQRRAA